jgi:hypothetical protein
MQQSPAAMTPRLKGDQSTESKQTTSGTSRRTPGAPARGLPKVFANTVARVTIVGRDPFAALCVEIHDEWLVPERRELSRETMYLLRGLPHDEALPPLDSGERLAWR